MSISFIQVNLLLAWLWILLGFASGLVLGLFFHRENWLGGYGSHKRRLYRLAHISLFGLGAVNLLFYLTAKSLPGADLLVPASWSFVAGAVSMPICCLLMAHFPQMRLLFAVPVSCLIAGGVLTLMLVCANEIYPALERNVPPRFQPAVLNKTDLSARHTEARWSSSRGPDSRLLL